MDLSDLAAYARKKYHIEEQHKWADFPGFSVLAEPGTGRWAALLMRQWDGETGAEIQRCDLKCGRECLSEIPAFFLSLPYRMKGQNWVGVLFDKSTDPEIVFRLFDRAVASVSQQGYTVVLEELKGNTKGLYHDTALPPRKKLLRGGSKKAVPSGSKEDGGAVRPDHRGDLHRQASSPPGTGETGGRIAPLIRSERFSLYADEPLSGRYSSTAIPQVPQKIREMMRLYEYRGESLEERSRNFYRQGKFMEDYEDDAPWTGEYRRYFTTYHDLHLPQLRGYFTWRTAVRKGEYRPIATSLAYMYVYELLCGIGTKSPEESLRKLIEFEEKFLDSGIGDPFMRRHIHRWMLDYSVIHNIPVETARLYEISSITERDLHMAVLKIPEKHSDEEIYSAFCSLGGKKLSKSPVITGNEKKGKHLFAALWRYLSDHYHSGRDVSAAEGKTAVQDVQDSEKDSDIFAFCFGRRRSCSWHPLANAVYWEEEKPQEAEYVLNECRTFRCRKGKWQEDRYDKLYYSADRMNGILHAADRLFRRYLKTGHYLRAKDEESWVEPYIEAVIAADIQEEKEAARPKITIDLTGLEKIRRDAGITRDSLLTEEEKKDGEESLQPVCVDKGLLPKKTAEPEEVIGLEKPVEAIERGKPVEVIESGKPVEAIEPEAPVETGATASCGGLDVLYTKILMALLRGEPAAPYIKNAHLIPSVVADTINEALFDEIGDNVLECDGNTITIVEDYREDLEAITGM